jgi:hypothetical protein
MSRDGRKRPARQQTPCSHLTRHLVGCHTKITTQPETRSKIGVSFSRQ